MNSLLTTLTEKRQVVPAQTIGPYLALDIRIAACAQVGSTPLLERAAHQAEDPHGAGNCWSRICTGVR